MGHHPFLRKEISMNARRRIVPVAASVLFVLAMAVSCGDAYGQTLSQTYGDPLTKQTQTLFVRADANYTTYQSGAVNSNASATTTTFTAGAYAGESRRLGVFLTANDQRIPFELNNSEATNAWRDLYFQARFGWFYPSVILSQSEMTIDRGNETILDCYGNGAGGGLGFFMPVNTFIVVYGEGQSVVTQHVRDHADRKVEVGARNEGEAGASIDVIHGFVDFILGYKYRSYSVKLEDVAYNEVQTAPFAGMRLGVYF